MVESTMHRQSIVNETSKKIEMYFPEFKIESEIDPNHLVELKRQVLFKLTQRSTDGSKEINLYNLDREYAELYNMCENTIKYNEGKSVLLVGPRGSGKTTLINNVICDLKKVYPRGFFAIKINGFIQTDDKSAVREIARQLDSNLTELNDDENGEEDEDEEGNDGDDTMRGLLGKKSSVSTTMSAIMSILDKSQLNDSNEEEFSGADKKENMHIPIIFILEEFDRYTTNAKQSLLYNLFDVSQASSVSPIAIIGVSTKTTVREMLEKRVKSRFSQKIVQITKQKSLDEFCEAFYNVLKVDNILLSSGEDDEDYKRLIENYNDIIKMMVFNKQFKLRGLIVKNFYTIKDINHLKNSVIPMITKINIDKGLVPNEEYINTREDLVNNRAFINILDSLSNLQLQILIGATKTSLRYGIDQVNFNISYEEYLKNFKEQNQENRSGFIQFDGSLSSIGNVSVDREWSKDVLLLCWEKLIEFGLLLEPLRQLNGINPSSFTGGEFSKMYLIDVNLDEIRKYFEKRSGYEWVSKWCRLG